MEKAHYDIVIMDCQMPEMDGYTATGEIRNLRSNVLNHSVPIIAMTAHAIKGDREKCLASGMDDYISKPIQPEKLLEVIDKWLSRSKKVHPEKEPADIPSANKVFDKSGFLNRLLGDKTLAAEILDGFLSNVPSQVRELKKAVDIGDAQTIRQKAHSLKGASANIGAMALEEIALQVELAGKDNDLIKASSLISELDNQFKILKESLPSNF